ncbi:putative heat shock protein Hsp20 [Monocercomonoides exilis]|uniref:putative heat shock protein Hsp20 n=1 Tax=Monocercomonoides exilis TaxID=2049356 RepID=UPI00355A1C58|nr:putative heat shock protein Hsp20 [Monocercomonoides exilis]|eukprot:MONOS_15321.1-p1 / transcript=MONOS_15321.1 / gene=MONOS_15321 / organism=Monocercomonoides_exilis_PA203 / gene_product=heat shock protein Hsp20 / transcript_product=heat shock protein Hsp20 / location=Mono_scaffold01198:2251-2883(+) / protein_length=210 / sequence_SO=supercontig / SO=protein_coding / is_pseudo=false
MALWNLRHDLNSLFSSPFVFDDPWEGYNELRRRTLDLFDTHVPYLEDGSKGDSDGEGEGNNKKGRKAHSSTNQTAITKKNSDSAITKMQQPSFWMPRCDVKETDNEVIISAELPGLKKEDMKIEFDEGNNTLILSGDRKQEKSEDKKTKHGRYYYSERSYGSFKRSFRLPEECASKISECSAKTSDGILEIHCPKDEKKAESKRKQISIE